MKAARFVLGVILWQCLIHPPYWGMKDDQYIRDYWTSRIER